MHDTLTPPVFKHKNLLGIHELTSEDIKFLLTKAQDNLLISRQANKKKGNFIGHTQINLFLENSTRTQSSFEIAGKRLGLDVINFSNATSSLKKGESLIDTVYTLQAMNPDILVLRHHASGAAAFLAKHVNCSILNAGDGKHEHPTQALLDALTIHTHKGYIQGLKIAICGDVLHSRVARSNILCLNKLGAYIRLIGPSTLLPSYAKEMAVTVYNDYKDGLKDVDVIITLRLQKERMEGAFLSSLDEYYHYYGLTQEKLIYAKHDCIVLHPGPMNRGVEIASDIADGQQSLITRQVEMGVAMRMAIIEAILEGKCTKQKGQI